MAQIIYQKKGGDYEVEQIEAVKARLNNYGIYQCPGISDTYTENEREYVGTQQNPIPIMPLSIVFCKSVRYKKGSGIDTVIFENKANKPIKEDSNEYKIIKDLERMLRPELLTNFRGEIFIDVDEAIRLYNIRQIVN